jgi:hypothetical protein
MGPRPGCTNPRKERLLLNAHVFPKDTLVDQLLAQANANSDQYLELTKAAKKLKKREDRSMSNAGFGQTTGCFFSYSPTPAPSEPLLRNFREMMAPRQLLKVQNGVCADWA